MTRFRNRAAGLLLATLLAGCQAPVTYAPGHSAAQLLQQHNMVVLESVSPATMRGDAPLANPSPTQRHATDLVQSEIISRLEASGIAVATQQNQCPDCVALRGMIYYLPWNPIIGGHINVFINVYDGGGNKLLTAFYGRDFQLVNLVISGADGITRSSADHATNSLLKALRGGGS